nr:copia protein [Tanacetum cinerariifolium]
MIKVLPLKTAKEVVARERERKARTTLLMALPEDHLEKFHKMADTKEMFQTLLSQLEIHGAGVSHEDANQNFLRSLPSSWSQVALIMRTKPGLDTFSFDDLYNNLRVFKSDVKGTTASSSNTHNVAFVSADNTSSTNDVSIAYSVSSPSVLKSQKEGSSSYTDEINDDDMEEMDLKWQMAMISTRIKKFHKRTCGKLQFDTKDPVGFDKAKVECFNCHKMRHFARNCRAKRNQDIRRRDAGYDGNKARDNGRRPAYQEDSKALVTIHGKDIDWSRHVEEDVLNYAMMAYSSSNLGSANETSVNESDAKTSEYTSCECDSSVETTTSMPAPVENAPKVVYEPKVWADAPIIKEYKSDSDDDSVSNVQEDKEKLIFAFTDSVKHVKPSREKVKETSTPNHYPKVGKQGRNGHIRNGLIYAFTRKSCFVCGSFSHLIRDCDFHEKRMAKQAALTKSKNMVSGQKDNRPVWNNVKTVNHQNKFVPKILLTKTSKVSVNAARQNYSRQAASTSTASKVNTARPFVNETRPKRCFIRLVHLIKGPFITKQHNELLFHLTKLILLTHHLVLLREIRILLLRPQQDVIGETKEIIRTKSLNTIVDQEDPHKALKDKGIVDSGYSRHMTGNKEYLADYQEFKGGFVTFGGRYGKITGKEKIKAGRSDNRTEFKNNDLIEFSGLKGIKKEYSNARTPQQNGVAERKNRTLIEAVRTMCKSEEIDLHDEHFVLPIWSAYSTTFKSSGGKIEKTTDDANTNSTNLLNVVGTPISTVGPSRTLNNGEPSYLDDPLIPYLEDMPVKQEEAIDYDEVFAPVARIEAIRIFLAFSSYMGFIVYQMDVKSTFLYSTIDKEVYVTQPLGFVDPKFPNKVYKVVKALCGLHQAPRAWYATLSTFLEKSRYRRGAIDKTLFIKQDKKDIMLVQVYVDDIIFGSTKKYWCDEFKELMKNRFQMSSRVKRIFRYLKGQLKLGLWYCKVSSFDLKAYSNSDYASANLDRKSTTRGCQFLGKRLISWQCKKKTIVATSTTEAEYVVVAHCSTLVKGRLLEVTTVKHRLILPSIENGHQFTISNLHQELTGPEANGFCKELASPKQTALGKDTLNPLIVDSLLKIIWLSMHHVITMKHWLF